MQHYVCCWQHSKPTEGSVVSSCRKQILRLWPHGIHNFDLDKGEIVTGSITSDQLGDDDDDYDDADDDDDGGGGGDADADDDGDDDDDDDGDDDDDDDDHDESKEAE